MTLSIVEPPERPTRPDHDELVPSPPPAATDRVDGDDLTVDLDDGSSDEDDEFSDEFEEQLRELLVQEGIIDAE
ncbi:hypothetical protein JOD63_000012 [Microbacterium terrae]|uniref:Uncharacterized protein n=1 Tax=Microbacterium terrae TaxID=69369 RepID=A0A0M2H447_9MICO|nr:hypothetical protein [Microbacterium terrae]KJL38626.1 hypothetical protein RS81_02421 [Microbacterium terrae]MBP1076044.1 hypothetical protein [Microbacterium terrae]GLJ96864.1 hypothetical protein GCM10017594_00610 [Microbacterium terrae]